MAAEGGTGRDDGRRLEPWPIALALLLAAMISVSIGFYAVAAVHPDPPVRESPP